MKYTFSKIVIVYNPNSTGESKKNAQALRGSLHGELPKGVTVSLRATSHAGHAIEIGAHYAKKDDDVLLISSSGDGGYNELINGVLQHHDTKNLAVMVLPSGNANDHHHATNNEDIVSRIVAGKTAKIDVLKIEAMVKGKPWTHYAHSYIGIGLTAFVGKRLTAASLNPVKEKWLVVRYLLAFRHVTVRLGTHRYQHQYSSLVFANINRMSKIIRLAKDAQINDGIFEVYETRYRSLWRIIRVLLIGSTVGLTPTSRRDRITFQTKKALEVQCDGEVTKLDGRSTVAVTSEKCRLRVIR